MRPHLTPTLKTSKVYRPQKPPRIPRASRSDHRRVLPRRRLPKSGEENIRAIRQPVGFMIPQQFQIWPFWWCASIFQGQNAGFSSYQRLNSCTNMVFSPIAPSVLELLRISIRVIRDCGIHHILRGLCIIGTTTNTLKYKEATMKTKPARDRLSEKNCRGLLVNHLRTRYAFSPAMADVLAEDALYLRTISAPGRRQAGKSSGTRSRTQNLLAKPSRTVSMGRSP